MEHDSRQFNHLPALIILFFILINLTVNGQTPVNPGSITDKVVCGYQGWFNCIGDGSPINSWYHWSGNPMPAPGNLSFEIYPDVSVYEEPDLFQTGFANLGNGEPSRLFSSYRPDVVDRHFALMQEHGIDGVALQRFISEVLSSDPNLKANRDAIALNVKNAAETYGRLFYLTYDLSGLDGVQGMTDEQRYNAIKTDWQNTIVNTLGLSASPMYARQDGKAVVELWGPGFTHVIGNPTLALDLVNWFKAQGCYVIGGVPTYWRTGTNDSRADFANVYLAFDMISPWTVGRFSNISGANSYKTNLLAPDLAYCNSNGMDYMPVVFPGFAWSNWVSGGTRNQIPRDKGEFMWQQVENIQSLGIARVYVAMFDEYDEGTAILSMADGYDMIPTNQYFLTSSADGTYISPDFYLRLTGKATRVIRGEDPVTTTVTIPFSEGPVYFRTSLEEYSDPYLSWSSSTYIESRTNVSAYGSNSGSPSCAITAENPHRGLREITVQGRDRNSSSSYVYFKVFNVDIPVEDATMLSFWTYPENELARYASVDLVMTDGTTLRDSGAEDDQGGSMHPAAGRGVAGNWVKTTCIIGDWLSGKTIDRILIAYDHADGTGDFRAYIDDISIETEVAQTTCSWTGTVNSDWFDTRNWSTGQVPSSTTDIYIAPGASNVPAIGSAGAACRDISIYTPMAFSGSDTLYVYGDWRANDDLHMPVSSTITFKGSENTVIEGYTYFYNLVVNKSGPAIALTDEDGVYPMTSFEVANDLTLISGNLVLNGSDWDYFIGRDVILKTSGTLTSNHHFDLHVKGNWTNDGGNYNIILRPGALNRVVFDGTGNQAINGTAVSQTFYNMKISKASGIMGTGSSTTVLTVNDLETAAGSYTAPATLNINGQTILTGGTLTAGADIITKGNWTNNSTAFQPGTGTVTFDGITQTVDGSAAPLSFHNLEINTTSGTYFNINAFLSGYLLVSPASSLIINPGKTITVGNP